MKNLLTALGLVRKIQPSLPEGKPVCNVSVKTNYFNQLGLFVQDFERAYGRQPTSQEVESFDGRLQAEMGVRVACHSGYISFS